MSTEPNASENRDPPLARAGPHLFTVRIWKEERAGAAVYRGNVRDVASGAYRNFRDWTDLTSFMLARLEDAEMTRVERTEGER